MAVLEDDSMNRWDFSKQLPSDKNVLAKNSSRAGTESGGATDPAAIGHVAHRQQLADFVQAINAGRPPLIDGAEARKSVALISSIYQSSAEGRPIKL